jgi:hypothetical protein
MMSVEMTMQHATAQASPVDVRRKRARRTAWWIGGLAFVIYAGFILISALGH